MVNLKKIYIFISFVIILTTIYGCEKIPFDYRNKYCGDWNFTTEYQYFMMDSGSFDTVYIYDGRIWYNESGKINIEYRKDIILAFEINEQGEITSDAYYPVNGEFSDKNNLSFYRRTGGLGSGVRENVSGTKK